MKAASLKEIQTELENLSDKELAALCLRLARFKKENKEMLTYLLFESFDEPAFVRQLKEEVTEQFAAMNDSSLYFVKKSVRKILRLITKYSRYTGSAAVEVQLLLHFCERLAHCGIDFSDSKVMMNIYRNQLSKIRKLVSGFHEDLQYDYLKELQAIDPAT